jgi:hypothetical protein
MGKQDQHPPAGEEGPRSFAVILAKIAQGTCEAELSRKLHELTLVIKEDARAREALAKGSLVLKLFLEVDGKDRNPMVKVGFDIDTKPPKPVRRNGHFWLTEGGNLTDQAPRQESLPLQQVVGGRQPLRQIDRDAGAGEG